MRSAISNISLTNSGWTDRTFCPSHNGLPPHGRADEWVGIWIAAGVTGLVVGLAF